MNKQLTIRASLLWFPGILIITIGILIHARVAWIFRYNAFINEHAIACELGVDLSKHDIEEIAFVPLFTRNFMFGFILRTNIPDKVDQRKRSQDIFSSNRIEETIKVETFEVSWQLYKDGKNIANGIITEKNLSEKVQTTDIRYIFAKQNISLEAGQNYKLVAEVIKPSEALGAFSPTLLIRTWSSLKGRMLVGWKVRDTLLCLALGSFLIVGGLLKQYFTSSNLQENESI